MPDDQPQLVKFMVLAGGNWLPIYAESEDDAREKCSARGLAVQTIQAADAPIVAEDGQRPVERLGGPPEAWFDAEGKCIASGEEMAEYWTREWGRPIQLVSVEETKQIEAERRAETAAKLTEEAKFPTQYGAIGLAEYCKDAGADDAAWQRGVEWLNQVDDADGVRGLYLYGSVGTGKTTLAEALGRQWIASRVRAARFIGVTHLVGLMRSSFGTGQRPEIADQVLQTPLLILDDLGAEVPRDWICELLYEAVNERLTKRRPTIFTSNLDLSQLEDRLARGDEHQGPRIAWRVKEMCWPAGRGYVVEMNGTNFRDRR